jgi:hypothetical protein
MRALPAAAALAGLSVLAGCAEQPTIPSLPAAPPPSASPAAPVAAPSSPPGSWIPATSSPDPVLAPTEVAGIGPYRRAVSNTDAESQRWFDQGLNLLYGFNKPEAIRDFTQAAAHSPSCAMCFWGIAYASGTDINSPALAEKAAKSVHAALAQAQALAGQASPVPTRTSARTRRRTSSRLLRT